MTRALTRLVGARRAARRVALGAVAGPALFTLAWLGFGALRRGEASPAAIRREQASPGLRSTAYSPIRQPISELGVGASAPYMNTAFVVTGLLLAAGVVGVFRALPPPESGTPGAGAFVAARPALRGCSAALLACTGVGQALCGIFTLEATAPHSFGFALAAVTPIAAFPVAGRWFRAVDGCRRFGRWLPLGGPLTLVLLLGYAALLKATDGAQRGVAGLVQRVLVLQIHAWFAAMGWLAYRHGRRASG